MKKILKIQHIVLTHCPEKKKILKIKRQRAHHAECDSYVCTCKSFIRAQIYTKLKE